MPNDLISREAARAAIENLRHMLGTADEHNRGIREGLQMAAVTIDALPAADAGEGQLEECASDLSSNPAPG